MVYDRFDVIVKAHLTETELISSWFSQLWVGVFKWFVLNVVHFTRLHGKHCLSIFCITQRQCITHLEIK